MTSTRQIPLLDRRGDTVAYALVDEDLAELLLGRRWHRDSHGYARTYTSDHRPVLMHRLVLDLDDSAKFCDHINRDPLDNRRANLRVVTPAENMQNRRSHRGSRSRFRGVYWKGGRHQRWAAQARQNGRIVFLGYFTDEVDAAIAAQAWRRENMPYAQPDEALEAVLA